MDSDERTLESKRMAEWLAAASAVALLRTCYEADVLDHLAEGMTVAGLAEALGCEVERATLLCQALEAHEIIERTEGRYRVRPSVHALDADDQPLRLRELVMANAALQRGIESFLSVRPGFQEVGEQESLDFARLAWGRPQSAVARAMWTEVDGQMPEVVRIWEAGGSYAEFGCGVGRDLLRVAVMYPKVRVTGHDCLPHLIEECRTEARKLGVSDRVRLVEGDVGTLDIENAYDTLMWSQMFFPGGTRKQVLACIHRALVAGGYLIMPKMPAVPDPENTDSSAATRGLMLARLAYDRWQIRWDAEDALRREVEASGYRYVRSLPNPRTPYLLFAAG